MKKLVLTSFILALFLGISAQAHADDWTYKIKQNSEKTEDTLWVDVVYTDGVKTIEARVAVFQPVSAAVVHTAIKNRFVSEKKKLDAESVIDTIKPDVDKDVNKPFPTSIAG